MFLALRPLSQAFRHLSLASAFLLFSASALAELPIEAPIPSIQNKGMLGDTAVFEFQMNNGSPMQIEAKAAKGVPDEQFQRVLGEVARTLKAVGKWFELPSRIGLVVAQPSNNATVDLLRDDDGYISYLTMPYELFVFDATPARNVPLSESQWRTVLIHEIGHILYRQNIRHWETALNKFFPYGQKPSNYPKISDLLTEMFADLIAVTLLNDPQAVANSLTTSKQDRPLNADLRDFRFGEANPTKWQTFYLPFGGIEGELMKDRHLMLSPARFWIWGHLFAGEQNLDRRMLTIDKLFRIVVENKIDWESYQGELTAQRFNELLVKAIEDTGLVL